MNLERKYLQLAEIYGGEKGYIHVRDNAAGKGRDIGKVNNGTPVLVPVRDLLTPAQLRVYIDSGWCQVADTSNDNIWFAATGENWVEMSHVKPLAADPVPPPPAPAKKRYKVSAVFEIEEL